jgi:hypothetical protein
LKPVSNSGSIKKRPEQTSYRSQTSQIFFRVEYFNIGDFESLERHVLARLPITRSPPSIMGSFPIVTIRVHLG